ncbi:MAG: GGDEF domain-containing protein [Pseudomonadota bacterium]|nr:GGDEF domain-containing protein [Pseudomonadota bacterium]
MPRSPLLQLQLRTLLVATVLIAVTLLSLVLVPQFMARKARLQVLRMDVDQVARLAASHVDGDLHRQLLAGTADESMLARARVPLIRLHERWPEAYYVYTMGIIDGQARFILDTAQDAQFAASRGLRASSYLEPYEQRAEYRDDWLQRLSSGQTYVTPGFQVDDYGTFLSGHAPIFDSGGQVAGFVGVDFGLEYYLAQEAHFRRIERTSGGVALLLSLLLGYLHARRQHAQQAEVRRHYHSSMQDPLTGLPNRRGAMLAINELWSTPEVHSHAALLVDVDHFKQINDTHGHRTGDDVLRALASALSSSVRPGDITARLGGDEFLIFARDCDQQGAEQIAARLLAAVRAVESPTRFTVSVGLGIATNLQGGFDLLYRHADSALYQAKGSGRNRYSSYEEAIVS